MDNDEIEVLVISSQNQKGKGMLLPKGGWELDESKKEAALRETLEEAGVRGIVGKNSKGDLISVMKAEIEELESTLSKEKLQTLQLKQEWAEAESRNSDLYKELQSVRGQPAAEQSRCFKFEVCCTNASKRYILSEHYDCVL
ncbi:unnamed protein product [Lupinus luteus]|uniref:Nudix hydrolase domain-containing protein n=1 Tax=Lupinus luteus TaxID=3873 RepID=A0AAV1WQL6_LUPLU